MTGALGAAAAAGFKRKPSAEPVTAELSLENLLPPELRGGKTRGGEKNAAHERECGPGNSVSLALAMAAAASRGLTTAIAAQSRRLYLFVMSETVLFPPLHHHHHPPFTHPSTLCLRDNVPIWAESASAVLTHVSAG